MSNEPVTNSMAGAHIDPAPRLDAPALIGSTIFNTGVSWATVIGRAQREFAWRLQDPSDTSLPTRSDVLADFKRFHMAQAPTATDAHRAFAHAKVLQAGPDEASRVAFVTPNGCSATDAFLLAAMRDVQRLNWLQTHPHTVYTSNDPETLKIHHFVAVHETRGSRTGMVRPTVREAIDACMPDPSAGQKPAQERVGLVEPTPRCTVAVSDLEAMLVSWTERFLIQEDCELELRALIDKARGG